jgi:hypothetical protein
MSLKTLLVSRIAAIFTGEKRVVRNRAMLESRRLAASAPHTVEYFHEAADPYSHLAAQVLANLLARYDIALQVHLVRALGLDCVLGGGGHCAQGAGGGGGLLPQRKRP